MIENNVIELEIKPKNTANHIYRANQAAEKYVAKFQKPDLVDPFLWDGFMKMAEGGYVAGYLDSILSEGPL